MCREADADEDQAVTAIDDAMVPDRSAVSVPPETGKVELKRSNDG
jgi:hypothetical protein